MFYQFLLVCLILYLIQVPLSTMKINLFTVMSEQIQHLFPPTACMKDFFNVQAKPKKKYVKKN